MEEPGVVSLEELAGRLVGPEIMLITRVLQTTGLVRIQPLARKIGGFVRAMDNPGYQDLGGEKRLVGLVDMFKRFILCN